MKPMTFSLPKFALLKKDLGVGISRAAGILEVMWFLAASHSPEIGELRYTPEQLVAYCEEDIDPDRMWSALVKGKWIDEVDGVFYIHDWKDHRPTYLKDRIRQSRHRTRLSRDCHVTVTGASRDCHDPSDSDSVSASGSVLDPPISPHEIDNGERESGYTDDFEKWWITYPKKGRSDKRKAFKAFKVALRGVDFDHLMKATMDYSQSPKVLEGVYVKHATTWLNGGCWDDDHEAWKTKGINDYGRTPEEQAAFERAL